MLTETRRLESILAACLIACLAGTALAQRQHVVPEGPLSPEEQLKKFHLPPGFEIELVASEPEIGNPLNLSFDSQGRLWVTYTVEYPFPPKGPGRDALKVFEDRDGDGRFETSHTLVDKLSMPTGAAPIPGGAVVFSVPGIYGCLDAEGTQLRIAHNEIEERFTSPLSPMPNAAEKTVDAEDFSHLVRYLLDAREAPL